MDELYAPNAPDQLLLSDPLVSIAVIGILVRRLGGQVTITQEDFDSIFRHRLLERYKPDEQAVVLLLQGRPPLSS